MSPQAPVKRPNSAPFRDYWRLKFEADKEEKFGVPATREVYLPMRLDNQRPSEGLIKPNQPSRLGGFSADPKDFLHSQAPRGAQEIVLQRFQEARVDLKVPFADRDEAKSAGARWDSGETGGNKTWYAPPQTDLKQMARWLPGNVTIASGAPSAPGAKSVVPASIAAQRSVSAPVAQPVMAGVSAGVERPQEKKEVVAQTAFDMEETISAHEPSLHDLAQDDDEIPPLDASDDLPQF